MLTCGIWVKRGIAKEVPDKVALSEDELKQLLEETKEKIRDAEETDVKDLDDEQMKILNKNTSDIKTENVDNNEDSDAEIREEYGLDDYDGEGTLMDGAGMSGLMYFKSNDEDPYINIKDMEDEEQEDFLIKKEDNLFVVGKMEDDYSCLDVYVYNEDEDSCYVHHDIILDSFPLCLEWLSFDPTLNGKSGNYVAVGTMEPDINVWDLDVVDTVEPAFTLVGTKKKKKKKKSDSQNVSGHTDAVLSISWNYNVRNVLASGSADKTIILWDLSKCACVHALKHHTDKVQSISWHPFETQSLLSGAFDKTAKVLDCRSPNVFKSWDLSGECEQVLWDRFSPYNFLVSSDDGKICYFDVRTDKPVFMLHAHDGAVGGMALSTQVAGCLTTVSSDKQLKVWDYQDNSPKCVMSRDMKMGSLNFISASPDSSLTFALGGQKDGVRILNLFETTQGAQYFSSRKPLKTSPVKASNEVTVKLEEDIKQENDDVMDTENIASEAMSVLSLQVKKENIDFDDKNIIKKKKKKKRK